MIRLSRVRSEEAITGGLRGRHRVNKLLLLLEGKRAGNLIFNPDYWKKAKDQLKLETHGKCAYCESPTSSVAHGDVEHFRPKSVYWWLAYYYDNYLFSCQICNQSYKLDNFPIYGTRMNLDPPFPNPFPTNKTPEELRAMAALFAPDPLNDAEGYPMARFLKAATREKPGLIDPYSMDLDPELLFKWTADEVLGEVFIAPRNNRVATRRAFEAATTFLGLNREELRAERWKTYRHLRVFANTVISTEPVPDNIRNDAKTMIKLMMANDAPYAGMVRYFVNEWQLDLE